MLIDTVFYNMQNDRERGDENDSKQHAHEVRCLWCYDVRPDMVIDGMMDGMLDDDTSNVSFSPCH